MKVGYVDQAGLPFFQNLLWKPERDSKLTVLGLTDDNTACGAIALRAMDGSVEITSLYVDPDHRRKGGATMLMNAARELVNESDRWSELWADYTVTDDEGRTMDGFMQAMGFLPEHEALPLRAIRLKNLAKQEFFTKDSSQGTPFRELDPALRQAIYQKQAAQGTALMPRKVFMEQADEDVSMALVRDDQVEAFAVVRAQDADWVDLDWVVSEEPKLTPALLRSVATALRAKYAPDTVLAIQSVSEEADALLETLLPDAAILSRSVFLPI